MTRISMLFSSGKESVLALHLLRKQFRKAEITLIHFNYGQAAYFQEWKAALYYADLYKASYQRIDIDIEVPVGIVSGKGDIHVYSRNLVFIAMAVNWSLAHKITDILVPFTVASKGEFSDSTVQYLKMVQDSYKHLYPNLTLFSNLNTHSRQSHYELLKNKVDISHVWSCESKGVFTDGVRPMHCGQCEKCLDFLNKVPQIERYLTKVNYYRYDKNS
jgi:7-cyano-7-deazaguanine synthase in queuosine biosynthesis